MTKRIAQMPPDGSLPILSFSACFNFFLRFLSEVKEAAGLSRALSKHQNQNA